MPPSRARLAYLVSQVPAVHHRYILEEIRGLRKWGFEIAIVSVHSPDRTRECMDPDERTAAAETFYVKQAGLLRALGAHARTLLGMPLRYAAGILACLRFSRLCPADLLRHFFYLTEALIAGQWMRARALTYLHAHYTSTVAWFIHEVFRIRASHTLHGPAEFENAAAFHLREKIRDAVFVAAISHYGRSQILKYTAPEQWNKVAVCPLGIDVRKFSGELRRRSGPFHVITVGRLSPEKGHLILFAALERLVRSGRDVRLTILGDGPSREILERAVREQSLAGAVIFRGWVNNDAAAGAYREADAFVLPSFAEGLPVALMEAMAAGLPCIATRIAGIPELIEDGESGLLVSPADIDGLAEALVRLHDNEELCARLGRAGRQRAGGRSAEDSVSRLAELLRANL